MSMEMNKGSVEQAGGDERAAFEQWEAEQIAFVLRQIGSMDADDIDGDNVDLRFEDASGRDTGCDVSIVDYAEKAANLIEAMLSDRAALAQPSPAQAEQAEAERPEVVAYLFVKPDGTLSMDAVRHKPSQPAVAVMTVAQHERIVEARWNRAMDLLLDHVSRISEKFKAERDAALARVEQQERTIAGMNEAHAKLAGLHEAAQAQHSVPGDIMRDAQRYRWLRDQQFYFSFSTENSDAGISSCTAGMSSRFKNLSWVDAAIDSAIDDAPGKEGV